jgi:hypothetical protein
MACTSQPPTVCPSTARSTSPVPSVCRSAMRSSAEITTPMRSKVSALGPFVGLSEAVFGGGGRRDGANSGRSTNSENVLIGGFSGGASLENSNESLTRVVLGVDSGINTGPATNSQAKIAARIADRRKKRPTRWFRDLVIQSTRESDNTSGVQQQTQVISIGCHPESTKDIMGKMRRYLRLSMPDWWPAQLCILSGDRVSEKTTCGFCVPKPIWRLKEGTSFLLVQVDVLRAGPPRMRRANIGGRSHPAPKQVSLMTLADQDSRYRPAAVAYVSFLSLIAQRTHRCSRSGAILNKTTGGTSMRWVLACVVVVATSIGLGGCFQNAIIISPDDAWPHSPANPPPPK